MSRKNKHHGKPLDDPRDTALVEAAQVLKELIELRDQWTTIESPHGEWLIARGRAALAMAGAT